ncbi:S-layer homology domain-containing protein [Paenibacillus endoradicis]|uniref:S-layer homology domain-containing protein n=1 Tax=Paenibacillus endoradicis TaxID=2972487 RepID=UPI002158B989|nr:S-layer homology domain-containing protein [Paenibacillus endoradicis]MCR8657272.1 S-layer homology domain-containing protein [Paenibacillus endoradicis]
MMKQLKMMLCMLLLVAVLPSYVYGANDAADLSYRVNITVTDSSGSPKSSFDVGEEIFVKLSLAYTGAGKAPVYGFQGKLQFDSYVLKNTSVNMEKDISMKYSDGVINYVFLDMTANGKDDSMLHNIGTAVFQARNNGTLSFSLGSFIVTNKDATQRYITPFEDVQIIVGTGIKEASKSSLYEDIVAAKSYLASVIIADNPKTIYSPDFWYSTKSAQNLRNVIAEVEAVFENEHALDSEITEAIEKLSIAFSNFENSKIVGPKRWVVSDDDSNNKLNYSVKASVKGGNGKIADGFESQTIRATTSATIRMIPDEGYETEYIYINGEKFIGRDIYTIPEISRDTTVVVTFVRIPPFTDIAHDDWFYFSVRYAYNAGLFTGTSETKFSPSGKMSRAMLATALYRMADQPDVEFTDVFSDVQSGLWYSDPIIWANQNQIVNGNGKGMFAPNDSVTREQIAVMLHRYAQSKGFDLHTTSSSLNFKDVNKISSYAKEAISWAVSKGIMKGNSDSTLNPSGLATRAEVATMLQRFIELE